jgi:DNA-binding PadR family transcriptional regulator
MGKDYIGEFEELVLLAILKLGNDTYGVPIREALEEATGRMTSVGALYTTLERLEKKGMINSRMGEPTSERGGRAKRFFSVKASGVEAIREAHRARRSMSVGLEAVLERIGG